MSDAKEIAETFGGHFDFDPSIFRHIERGLKANPHGPAVIAMHQAHDHLQELIGESTLNGEVPMDCLVWTHTQLHEAAKKMALGLLAQGIQPDSKLVTLIPNRAEWALILLTSEILGLTLCPLDDQTLTSPRRSQLESYMKILEPNVILVSNNAGTTAVDEALLASGGRRPLKVILDVDSHSPPPEDWVSLPMIAEKSKETKDRESDVLERAREQDPDHVRAIMFTSGTSSGTPKPVKALPYVFDSSASTWQMYGPDRFLLIGANFRAVASTFTYAVWRVGGAIVMPGTSFNPRTSLQAIEKYSITHVVMIPALLHAMLSDEKFGTYDLHSVKIAICGADIITKDILLQAQQAFPSAKISNAHGMTEGGGFLNWPFYGKSLNEIPTIGGIAPLGEIAPGSRIRIYDMDSGCVARRGEAGELHLSSPSTIKGYLGGVNADSFYEDDVGSWFKTGDQALLTADGIVYILGRYSDRFKRAGIPITPAALQTCLEQFVGSPVYVLGIPHPALGHEPFAVVKSFNGKTEEQMIDRILEEFGKDSALGGAASLAQMGLEDFPLNATGKIVRNELREKVMTFLGRAA